MLCLFFRILDLDQRFTLLFLLKHSIPDSFKFAGCSFIFSFATMYRGFESDGGVIVWCNIS